MIFFITMEISSMFTIEMIYRFRALWFKGDCYHHCNQQQETALLCPDFPCSSSIMFLFTSWVCLSDIYMNSCASYWFWYHESIFNISKNVLPMVTQAVTNKTHFLNCQPCFIVWTQQTLAIVLHTEREAFYEKYLDIVGSRLSFHLKNDFTCAYLFLYKIWTDWFLKLSHLKKT